MDLQEASLHMAKLMVRADRYYDEHIANVKPEEFTTLEEARAFQKIQEQYRWFVSEVKQFGNILAANPNFFDVLEIWIVTVGGRESVSRESMGSALEDNDLDRLLEQASNLASDVKDFIRQTGNFICDMTAGDNGWDLSVLCSEKDSKDLCTVLHRRYRRAVEIELLTISRKHTNHCIPGLHSIHDAKRILSLYGEDIDENTDEA